VRRASVVVELVEDHVVVTPAGELDLAVQIDLIEAFRDAIALQAEPRIVVDLSRITYMDSTTLGTLVGAVKKVKARGGRLSVVGASDRIARLLHIMELDTVMPLCAELGTPEALSSIAVRRKPPAPPSGRPTIPT
jgi:anti-anti-sigma factor